MWPFICRSAVALLLILLAWHEIAIAYSYRGAWLNNLKYLGHAIEQYHKTVGHYPSDVRDKDGKAILSWRVQILPWLEYLPLYNEFALDQAWDSPANAALVSPTPRSFIWPFALEKEPLKLTCVVQVRGKGTFFGKGGKRTANDVEYPAKTIMLVELHDNLPIWTQPSDWTYDPAGPRHGLPKQGFFAVFGDLQIRYIYKDLPDDMLRSLFTPEDEPDFAWEKAWHEVLFQGVLGWQIAIVLAFSLVAIAGGLLIGTRIYMAKPTTPGEMLWVVFGAQQLAYSCIFISHYTRDLVPTIFRERQDVPYWFMPAFAGTFTCLWLVWQLRSHPQWRYRLLFAGLSVILALVSVDALNPGQHRPIEESLITIGSPFILAGFALVLVAADMEKTSGRSQRPVAFWSGIMLAMLPVAWFVFWRLRGADYPQDMFVPRGIRF